MVVRFPIDTPDSLNATFDAKERIERLITHLRSATSLSCFLVFFDLRMRKLRKLLVKRKVEDGPNWVLTWT